MAQTPPTDDRDDASEAKFYHPAGDTPPFYVRRLERLWARLFSHRF